MQILDFSIGLEFYLGDKKYQCTDVGSRTVIAIRIDGVNVVRFNTEIGTKETFFDTEDEKWYEGPPYGVVEYVLDENDIENCIYEPDEVIS